MPSEGVTSGGSGIEYVELDTRNRCPVGVYFSTIACFSVDGVQRNGTVGGSFTAAIEVLRHIIGV